MELLSAIEREEHMNTNRLLGFPVGNYISFTVWGKNGNVALEIGNWLHVV